MSRGWQAIPIAGLCLILAACRATPPPAPPDTPASPPSVIAPRGPTAWPFAFSWQPVAGAEWVYRVVVTDRAERVLFDREVRGTTTVPAPDGLKRILDDRVELTWHVAITGPDGGELVKSEAVRFSLK